MNLLFVSLFGLILTSLIGNITALSRLFYALGEEGVMLAWLSDLNDKGIPYKAIFAILVVSAIVPSLGRTAIGWIVDVTTIGATITYVFVSAAALKAARTEKSSLKVGTGVIGLLAMIIMGALLVLPNLFTTTTMAPESFFFFIIWSLIGLIVFHRILRADSEKRFGESVVVWIALLAFVMFMSFVWMEQQSEDAAANALSNMRTYYEQDDGSGVGRVDKVSADELYEQEVEKVHVNDTVNTLIVLLLFAVALGVMISNYSYMRRKQQEDELLLEMERMRADKDPLTGVKNKIAYEEKRRALDGYIEDGSIEEFAIGVFDLNDLKMNNDEMGHAVGDDSIRAACKVICDAYKRSPVYRTGGDEFVVIVEGHDFANRLEILESVKEISEKNRQSGGVVLAAGMATYDPASDRSAREVFTRADKAMYDHKHLLKERAGEHADQA